MTASHSASPEQVLALAEAMAQLLDDMGKEGQGVCLFAKAQARIAWEPFREDDVDEFIMTLGEAQAIIDNVQR